MRHGRKFNHLGRTASHRKAMLSNMACSLIEHKRIETTVAKARELRKFVEPLITKSKNDTTHSRRVVFSYLKNKYAVTELFRDVAVKVGDRPGGYTRIIKLGTRLGDNAQMAMIELVDYNEMYTGKEEAKKTTRRSRRGGKSTTAAPATEAKAEETKKEAAPKAEAKTETKAAAAPKTEIKAKEEPKAEAKEEKKAPAKKAEAKEETKKAESKETKSEGSEDNA
jgi:large subunit ribosomal protein L17